MFYVDNLIKQVFTCIEIKKILLDYELFIINRDSSDGFHSLIIDG